MASALPRSELSRLAPTAANVRTSGRIRGRLVPVGRKRPGFGRDPRASGAHGPQRYAGRAGLVRVWCRWSANARTGRDLWATGAHGPQTYAGRAGSAGVRRPRAANVRGSGVLGTCLVPVGRKRTWSGANPMARAGPVGVWCCAVANVRSGGGRAGQQDLAVRLSCGGGGRGTSVADWRSGDASGMWGRGRGGAGG